VSVASRFPATRRLLERVATVLALVAGGLLLAAVAITTASVVRGAFGRPILGDSELVEMALGIAVALCLPLCEMRGSHVIVDFFTQGLPPRALAILTAVMRAVTALVIAVLAWRLAVGGWLNFERERATMFLILPYWWGYAGAALGMAMWMVTAAFVAIETAFQRPEPAQ
jgi:TRAP-type C4-dicarboxylate transport system permease small subunit